MIILLYWEKFSQINGYNNVNCILGAQNFKVFSISGLLKERSFEISSGPDSSLDRQWNTVIRSMDHHRKQLCQKTISQQAAMLIPGSKRQGFLSSYELSWQKRFGCCARQWSPSVFYTLFLHCVKSVRIRSFSGLYFPRIRTGYVEIRSIFLYSVRMWENMDQKNSEYKHFSSSVNFF